VRRFDDYSDVLKNKGRVILDREERKETILTDAKQLCAAQNLELVDDIGLLEEVAGLAEYPVVIMGDMDPSFLDLPPEVIKLSMRTHQKYFAVRDPEEGWAGAEVHRGGEPRSGRWRQEDRRGQFARAVGAPERCAVLLGQ
jgi:glycyl-tRNA synthetase beta chain